MYFSVLSVVAGPQRFQIRDLVGFPPTLFFSPGTTNKGDTCSILAMTINYTIDTIWNLWQCYGPYEFYFNYLSTEKGFKWQIHSFMQVLDIIQGHYN